MKYQQWNIAQRSQEAYKAMERQGVPTLVAATLCARGMTDLAEAKGLLSSGEDQLQDPFLMKDMDLATARIGRALRNGEKIAVYGDYDVDGITSTCLLTDFLRREGGTVIPYIPDRMEEGYGLNREAVAALRGQGVGIDAIMVTAANDSKTVDALLKLGVADYLVKPFTEADIGALTDELLARVPQPDKYMELKVEGSEIHLRYQDIVYAEHFAHLIYVHTTVQKTLATRQPFKTFIAPLKDDTRFFVCGRGVIVNLEHAKDLEGAAFRMADGSRVFVSQDLLKSARQAFMEFLLQRGRMV